MQTSRALTGAARAATAGAIGLAGGSAVLGSLRSGWADRLPVSSDTVAMAGAFNGFVRSASALSSLLAAAALVARPRPARAALAAVCVGICVGATVVSAGSPTTRRVATSPAAGARFTVLTLNVRLGRADPAAVLRATDGVDVVALVEVTAPQVAALDRLGLARRFPYRSEGRLPTDGGGGTAVWSRFPLTGTQQLSPAIAHQGWVTTVEVPGSAEPVTVVAVHPARPYVGGDRWLREQRALRAALPGAGPRVLVGDFNAVASHPTLRALVDDGWVSAAVQTGVGRVPTYPAGSLLPPLIDIDHVYLAGGVRATGLRTVPVTGTDHLGLRAELVLPG